MLQTEEPTDAAMRNDHSKRHLRLIIVAFCLEHGLPEKTNTPDRQKHGSHFPLQHALGIFFCSPVSNEITILPTATAIVMVTLTFY